MNPVLLSFLYAAVVVTVAMSATAWGIWLERKMSARMQTRYGPTMVGPIGLFQPIADLLKLLQKEDLIPEKADAFLFKLAPPLTVLLALGTAALVPLSPETASWGLDVGVPWALAFGALSVLPVWIAGWASHNKFALLGSMRAVAQGVSYEVPMVFAAMVPVILAGSMNLGEIVQYQRDHQWFAVWPAFIGIPAFVIFLLSMLAEANRIPFDIPEAESELVAGVTTEYTGMTFGFFYLAEYVHTVVGAAIASTLFLGGFSGPFAPGVHWLVAKVLVLFISIYWLRWTLLRFRADQLMNLAWKWLVPASLLLVAAAAMWRAWVS